jgi:hypothetical protein
MSEEKDKWKEAIIECCIIDCIDWDENDPGWTLRSLLAYEQDIALDPRVSSDAQRLVNKTIEECAKMVELYSTLWSNLPPEDSKSIAAFFARNLREEKKKTGMDIDPKDLRIDTYSSKPRGWISTPDFGVKITHLPSGITVQCEEARSQHKNKDTALKELEEKVKSWSGPHPDDLAVDKFAAMMKDKLKKSREKGRSGWDDPEQCEVSYLAKLLIDHVEKGDPVDIANIAMMLALRETPINVLGYEFGKLKAACYAQGFAQGVAIADSDA